MRSLRARFRDELFDDHIRYAILHRKPHGALSADQLVTVDLERCVVDWADHDCQEFLGNADSFRFARILECRGGVSHGVLPAVGVEPAAGLAEGTVTPSVSS